LADPGIQTVARMERSGMRGHRPAPRIALRSIQATLAIVFDAEGDGMMNLLFSTKGRIPRWMFWVGYLPTVLLAAPLVIAVEKFVGNNPIHILAVIALYVWIVICLTAKRLHDIDASGGYAVFGLMPLIAVIIGFIPGTADANRFG
jgi:uncharacterized membrane protein YhaH (DUF805 family)